MMEGLGEIQAVVLAGGQGTRLRPCVGDCPKPLAPVAGRPFLEWPLRRLAQWGVRDVLLCVGYGAGQIRAQFGSGHALGLRLDYSEEDVPLGTAGALRRALPQMVSDPVLVLNGDSYCEVPYDRFWAFYRRRSADGALVLVRAEESRRYGSVDIDADGRVVRFAEKTEGMTGSWINAGHYLFSRALLKTIPEGRCVSLEREMLPEWRRRLAGFAGAWAFLDIGTPDSYGLAHAFLAACQAERSVFRAGERSL